MRATTAALALALVLAASPAEGQAPGVPDAEEVPAAGAPAVEPTAAEPGRVTVALSPSETTVGGRVRAEVTVVWMGEAPAEPVRFPTWRETWGDAEVLGASPVESFEDQSGRHVARQVLELAAFETGEVDLPTRTFAVPLGERTVELESESARFTVESVLPPEAGEPAGGAQEPSAQDPGAQDPGAQDPGAQNPDAQNPALEQAAALEPRGNAPPTALEPRRAAFLATVAALVLLLGLGLERLRRLLAREIDGAREVGGPQDAFARLEPLAELEARLAQLDPAHAAAAHTGLSLALRRYLGRRLNFHAVESTTTEIQRRLLGGAQQATPPPAEVTQGALDLLRAADLVKFAGQGADAATVRARLDRARDLARRFEDHREAERARLAAPAEEAA